MNKKHLDMFFKKGRLKIGTLFDYKNNEQYGVAIHDPHEGLKISTMNNIDEINLLDGSPEASLLGKFWTYVGEDKDFVPTIKNIGYLEVHEPCRDYYIYCASYEFDLRIMREFGNACMEILDTPDFFKEISRKIRHKGEFQVDSAVFYMDRKADYRNPHQIHPAQIKDEKFEYQKEHRAIWEPRKIKIEPIVIDVPAARRYCRIRYPI